MDLMCVIEKYIELRAKQDELKKIYGCPLCRNKSPNDYEQWFQSLAEAVKRDHKIIRRNKNKKKEQDV